MQFSHPFIFSLFCVFASLREILFCLALFVQNVLTPSCQAAKKVLRQETSIRFFYPRAGMHCFYPLYLFFNLRLCADPFSLFSFKRDQSTPTGETVGDACDTIADQFRPKLITSPTDNSSAVGK